MAKKKKPAANPARGFATTSIASKPKPETEPEWKTASQPKKEDPRSETSDPGPSSNVGTTSSQDGQEKDLHELSPEELTAQLEKNELQLLVENLGPKIQRDVARLDSKLRTDGKVLRNQAQHVSFRKWLPEELMNEILDMIHQEREDEGSKAKSHASGKAVSEDDMVFRCWTLWEALHDFGFNRDHAKTAISYLLHNPPASDAGNYVWGFRESIEYLNVTLEESDLPSYEARKPRALGANDVMAAIDSGISTPDDASAVPPEPKQRLKSHAQDRSMPKEAEPEEEDISISDFDSDFDSDVEASDLVPTYLTMKERMYRYRPEVFDIPATKGKKGRSKQAPVQPARPMKPNARKLHLRLQGIESDPLFDSVEAEERWSLRRIQLMQEAANARALEKLTLEKPAESEGANEGRQNGVEDSQDTGSASGTHSPGSDDGGMIGDMFAVPTEESNSTPADANGQSVSLRDMGKLTGLNPRRILEDACRSKDGSANVSFRMVSATTYYSRHEATIRWSVAQERITALPVPYVRIDQKPSTKGPEFVSSMTFTMTEVANPDTKQSEAFVATIALFYVVSISQKEDKQYMKLPPSFRDLYLELVEFRKEHAYSADREKVKTIRDMIQTHAQQQEDDGVVLASAFRSRGLNSPKPGGSRTSSPPKAVSQGPSAELIQLWQSVSNTQNYQRMLVGRQQLPMFGFKEAALAAIQQSQVTILCGETGCGKSTQLPAYVLEHELSQGRQCKIYCTEPRRISAISLAQRVSEELGDRPGDVGTIRSLVGYAIRLESKISARTRLVYATVGVVLRMLENSKGLDDITHLIVDEVHERSIDTDFLLVILRALMIRRPELKVVLMSATVDATRFSQYLNSAPIINVPGRTFPVQTRFLEDAIELTHFSHANMKSFKQEDDGDGDVELDGGKSGIQQLQGYSQQTRKALAEYDEYRIDNELIVKLMEHIATDPSYANFAKATLIFLPGIAEIRELNDMITSSPIFQERCWVIPLHSTIASEDQQKAFLIPPPGVRKVVIATNIAETGITIPDVTCVIDTGKHKEMRYDERRQVSRLIQSFISKANAKQRRGRAGRVQEGLCFHLFTKYRHDEMMAEQQTPEMLRLSLQELVMRVKICGLGDIEETLAQALDPPLAKNVRRAIDALIEVGALTSTEELTALGSQLAKLPLDAVLGKLCLLSAIFGCLDVGLTISAILSSKSPFVTPFGDRQRADNARLAFAKGDSDLLTAYNAYTSWRRICQAPNQSVHAYCRKNYLSHQNLCNIEELKGNLLSNLAETGLLPQGKYTQRSHRRQPAFVQVPAELDGNSANEVIVQSIIAWSFYPKLLIRDGRGYRNIANSQQVSLHPSSVNKGQSTGNLKFISYYSMMASTSGAKYYNALSTTAVADVPIMLMVGDADWKLHAGVVVVDGNRLRFKVEGWKGALVLKWVRAKLEEFVDVRMKDPRREVMGKQRRWVEVWEKMCASYIERSQK